MTRILTYASLAYAAILVLALAGVLVTIWILLLRISGVLSRVQAHLEEVARLTQPLNGQLGALTTAVVTGAETVSRSVDTFADSVRTHLHAAPGRSR